ncbi:hypothetical protein JCM9152_204 [Halalkalibacter hemicellulosilyticusJCM 9152]|uniref:Uncharacterized protein n=1 Tax=Halalkalibacter hemicellulosilyticusJCM 9152 TaxID=1236971 RepID=W4QA61_9BACI|nr:hypothetical protein JCM9152_204 [Halalkalibacter hemicellulosilyticusJCM 9152]
MGIGKLKKKAISPFLKSIAGRSDNHFSFMDVMATIRPTPSFLCPLEKTPGAHKHKGNPHSANLGKPAS